MRKVVLMLVLCLWAVFGAAGVATAAGQDVSGAQISDLQAVINSDKLVTVRGVLSAGPGRLVAIQVAGPSGEVVHADGVLSYGLGGFESTIPLPNATPGIYQVTVNAVGVGASVQTTFAYGVNNELQSLALSKGGLDKPFASNVTEYAVTVDSRVESLTVTPTVADATATAKVNGITVVSGQPSAEITLAEGPNAITVAVTSLQGETKTYTVAVTKSTDIRANVMAQASIDGSKRVIVEGSIDAGAGHLITVLVTDPKGNPDYAGTTLSTGSGQFELSYDLANTMNGRYSVVVGALGHSTPATTYFDYIELTRLMLSGVALDPVFSKDTTVYTAAAARGVTETIVTPTCADSGARITVNEVEVASGAASDAISFDASTKVVNVVVTGQDGVASKTYAITIATGLRPTLKGSGEAAIDKYKSVAVTGQVGDAAGQPVSVLVADPSEQVDYVDIQETAAEGAFNFNYTTDNTAVGAYAVTVGAADIDNPIATSFLINKGDPNLSDLTLGGTPINLGYSADKTIYDVFVPFGTTALSLTPTAIDPMAIIKVNDVEVESGAASKSIELEKGENIAQVVVTTMDGQEKTYTVHIFCYSNDATLSGLALSNGRLSPSFAKDTTGYTATVDNSTNLLTVTATANDGTATLRVNGSTVGSGEGYGPILLVPGENTIEVLVTSGDKTAEKSYVLTVARAKSQDATLNSLKLSTGRLSPSFAADTSDYDVTVMSMVSSLSVIPTVHESTATVKVNGSAVASGSASNPIALQVGPNTIEVDVTAGDGSTTNTYTLFVTRERSKDSTLSGLGVSAGNLSPSFERQKLHYSMTVEDTVKWLTVTPTVNERTATMTVNGRDVASGRASGSIPLVVGKNTIQVEVTAGDGFTTTIYTITVTREASHDATLWGLSVSGYGTLKPSFAAETTSYEVSVWNEISQVTVTPVVNEETARVLVNGFAVASDQASPPVLLGVGKNAIEVQVTAGDKVTKKAYTIVVTRELPGSVNLSYLSVSRGGLNPTFSPTISGYSMDVDNDVSSLTLTAGSEDYRATVRLNNGSSGVGRVSSSIGLDVGRNTIMVEVTAQNGATKTYTIVVTRARSSNANLSGLTVSAGTLAPMFTSGRTTYAVSVDNNVESVKIGATTADEAATVTVNGSPVSAGGLSGSIGLHVGNNDIDVVVRAQDGTTKTYRVTVTRAPSTNANLSRVDFIGYEVGNAVINDSISVSDPDVTAYTVNVPNSVTGVWLMPDTQDAWASVKVDGATLPYNGFRSDLHTGSNTFSIMVTAQSGTTKVYTVTVYRAYNVNLKNLQINYGSIPLSPDFGENTTSYTARVGLSTSAIKVMPVAYADVAIEVNTKPLASDGASEPISLNSGLNTITVTVTAPDNTSQAYTLTVRKPYTVTYDKNGGELPASPAIQPAWEGEGVGTLPTPPMHNSHYTFKEWNTKANGTGDVFDGTTKVYSDMTVYAMWTAKEYTVSFNANGGSQPNPVSVKRPYGELVGAGPSPTTREHYVFDGWNTAANGTGTDLDSETTTVTGEMIFYAKWKPVKYTVTFHPNGGTGEVVPASLQVLYGTAPGELPTQTLTQEHYTFDGWNTRADGNGAAFTTGSIVTGDITVYAKWRPKNYTVRFDQDGGASPNYPASQTVAYEGTVQSAYLPPTPIRNHYDFAGWYTQRNGGGSELELDKTKVTGDITVYAKWTPKNYQVTYNATGGADVASEIVPYGQIGSLPVTTREHYTFAGWYPNESLTGPQVEFYTQVAGSITVYAKWVPMDYTVTFIANGGTLIGSDRRTVPYYQQVGALPQATLTYFVFGGWYTDLNDINTKVDTTTLVLGNMTVYAKWDPVLFTVTYDMNYTGGGTSSAQVYYGSTVSPLPQPTREHYTFSGWNTQADGNGTALTSISVTGNTTVYAIWDTVMYTVTFVKNNGDDSTAVMVPYEGVVSTLPAPTLDHYSLDGWNSQSDGSGDAFTTTTPVTGNITVYAQWSRLYGVSGSFIGGSVTTEPASAKAGTVVTLKVQPNSGWRLKAGTLVCLAGADPVSLVAVADGTYNFTMPAADVQVSAEFEQLTTVTFDQNGGSGGNLTVTVVKGASVGRDFPSDPTHETSAFKGWNTAQNGTGSAFTKDTPVTGDITVYAQWETEYSMVLEVVNSEGGAIGAEHLAGVAGSVMTVNVAPEDGYRLKSLQYSYGATNTLIFPDGGVYSFTMPAANITVIAEFERYYTVTFRNDAAEYATSDAASGRGVDNWPAAPSRADYRFMGWNTAADGSGSAFTASTTVNGSITVHAQWSRLYSIAIDEKLSGGTILASPPQAVAGELINLVISPDGGMRLVSGSLKYNGETITGTSFTMPAANVTVTAVFELIPPDVYSVSIGALEGGSISASPTTAEAGETINLKVTPSAGWRLVSGTLKYNDGVDHFLGAARSFTMPDKNVTVSARFESIPVVTLRQLSISAGVLDPLFAANTTEYAVEVDNVITSLTVTAEPTDPTADVEMTVGGKAVAGPIDLAIGDTVIKVKVTSADETETKTYTITVNRAGSSDATLSDLIVRMVVDGMPEELDLNHGHQQQEPPGFSPTVTEYFALSGAQVGSNCVLQIVPMVNESHATVGVAVGGEELTVDSGVFSMGIHLPADQYFLSCPITVIVTAQDGTSMTYSVELELVFW